MHENGVNLNLKLNEAVLKTIAWTIDRLLASQWKVNLDALVEKFSFLSLS